MSGDPDDLFRDEWWKDYSDENAARSWDDLIRYPHPIHKPSTEDRK